MSPSVEEFSEKCTTTNSTIWDKVRKVPFSDIRLKGGGVVEQCIRGGFGRGEAHMHDHNLKVES